MYPDKLLSNEVLYQFCAALSFAGGLLAIAVGIALLSGRTGLLSPASVLNRWISARGLLRPVEIPRDLEPVLHRYRRPLGAAVVFGAIFSLVALVNLDRSHLLQMAAGWKASPQAAEILLSSAKWFLVIGNAVGLAVGIGLLFFPGPLARVEAAANKWYSVRRHTRTANAMRLGLDQWVLAHPRLAGSVILLCGILVVVTMAGYAFG